MSRSSSNIIFSNLITQQNIIQNLSNLQIINSNYIMNYHYLDYVKDGQTNRFIINNIYDGDLTITKNLTTSNLNVIGDTTILNTSVYQTEQFEVINDTNATAILIRQNNINNNIADFYRQNDPALIISSNGNIIINKEDEEAIEKLEMIGNFKIQGDIYPDFNRTFDLGKFDKNFKNSYISNIYSSNLFSSNISINSFNNNPSLYINNRNNKNLIDVYRNNIPIFIINSNDSILINKNDIGFGEKVEIEGNIKISGNIYPEIDVFNTLGLINKRWFDIRTLNLNSTNIFTTFTTSSNILTSNISIYNNTNSPSLIVRQMNTNNNVAEFYSNNNPSLIISSNSFIGINKISGINERLDLIGNMKILGDIYPELNNINNIGRDNRRFKDIYASNSFTSNIYASNINIISRNNAPSLFINNINQVNILETYFNNNPALIINSIGNIAINKYDEGLIEKLEILGNMKIEGDIYPEIDITFDIGKDTNKVRNVYNSNLYSSNISIISSNAHP